MDELDDIDALDEDLISWEAALAIAMTALNRQLLEAMTNFLLGLSLRGRSTSVAELAANLRAVIFYRANLPGLVYRLGIEELLAGVLTHMGQSAGRLNSYYGRLVSDFQPGAYQAVIEQMGEQTRQILLSTVEKTYSQVIGDTLTMGVLTLSTVTELRQTLREKLENEGLSVKPVATVASDALYTFSRAYAQSVAEDLKLRHYYYMGTEITTTREFCHQRLGKAYTQAQVEGWASKQWAGKIPGTNAQTIFWYAGGYNCRHRLLPISKSLYNRLISQ